MVPVGTWLEELEARVAEEEEEAAELDEAADEDEAREADADEADEADATAEVEEALATGAPLELAAAFRQALSGEGRTTRGEA